jgi:hypothetical protein
MKVIITPEAKQRLELYTEFAKDEVSGLGRAYVFDGNIYVDEVYLLKQECSSSDTELDPQALAEFITQLVAAEEAPEEIKLWWHSHANMGVFWSPTDEGTAGKFGNGWMLSLVVNKKGEYKCRLDVYEPVHLTLDNVVMEVGLPHATKEFREALKKEVEEKVRTKAYQWTEIGGRGYYAPGFPGASETWKEKEKETGSSNGNATKQRAASVERDRFGRWEVLPGGGRRFIAWTKEEKEALNQLDEAEIDEYYAGFGGVS